MATALRGAAGGEGSGPPPSRAGPHEAARMQRQEMRIVRRQLSSLKLAKAKMTASLTRVYRSIIKRRMIAEPQENKLSHCRMVAHPFVSEWMIYLLR